jgi:thiol-disulfide isomerase/thioredoxin
LAANSDKISIAPDVPLSQLFDAIIAPHKGKVVVVDFWNTWCSPCRRALEKNESYKSGELASDDIVWIYIADESSPITTYLDMIPTIKGIHYRLNKEQMNHICGKFGIRSIPSYVFVKRDGSYALTNSFRDHDKMVKTLKQHLP